MGNPPVAVELVLLWLELPFHEANKAQLLNIGW